jgi:uncharacterized protein YcbK (DUF882 family)
MRKLTDHFYEHELACPTGECRMDPAFLIVLEALRVRVGVEFIITSGYRTPEYNARLKGHAGQSMHCLGIAVDVDHQKWDGATKHKFVREATALRLSIGIYPKHFHIDFRAAPQVLWIVSYKP